MSGAVLLLTVCQSHTESWQVRSRSLSLCLSLSLSVSLSVCLSLSLSLSLSVSLSLCLSLSLSVSLSLSLWSWDDVKRSIQQREEEPHSFTITRYVDGATNCLGVTIK